MQGSEVKEEVKAEALAALGALDLPDDSWPSLLRTSGLLDLLSRSLLVCACPLPNTRVRTVLGFSFAQIRSGVFICSGSSRGFPLFVRFILGF